MRKINSIIKKELLAYFWISLDLDENCVGRLNTSDIRYVICNNVHDAKRFWENTQYLIYQTTHQRSSLMGTLYNELIHKKTIHFACLVDEIDQMVFEVDCDNDDIYINVKIPNSDVYDDVDLQYSPACTCREIGINELINNGYDFAENQIKDDRISFLIIDYSKRIVKDLNLKLKKININEDYSSLLKLLQLALAYTYPTVLFKNKIFSSLLYCYKDNYGKEVSSGGLFLLWNNNHTFEEIRSIVSSIEFVKLRNIVYQYCGNRTTSSLLKIAKLQLDKATKEAVKSAKAAIMSRNMSHNLGSHVMFYIKQKLNSVEKMCGEDVLKDLYPNYLQELKIDKLDNLEFEMPFLVGLGRFINYLQERQDYIATIATDYIPANSTISFKDFIYDELKPDLRYKRHKERESSVTETKGHQPKNLLMDYIAYSEDYICSDQIRIKFGEFTGNNPETDNKVQAKSFTDLRQFNVALPGGVIGRQAFFSIIENIIRNAAKHSGHRSDGKLEIDIDVIDPEGDKWWENLQYYDEQYKDDKLLRDLYRRNSDKYYLLAITNNMPNEEVAIDKLVKNLGDRYVEHGNMKDSNKGLKEIRISAAWMRGYAIDTDIPESEPPVITIKKIPFDGIKDAYAIRYFICLSRPKKVAFVVTADFYKLKLKINFEDETKQENEINRINEAIARYGCRIYTPTSCSEKSLADYDVVLFFKSGEIDRTLASTLSSRFVYYYENDRNTFFDFIQSLVNDALNKEDCKVLSRIDEVYKFWCFSLYRKNIILTILDEKSKINHPDFIDTDDMKLSDTSNNDEKYYNNAVIYSTHYNGLSKEHERGYLYKNANFIEGITGNNSTDRLIRQSKWTNEWKYKHLVAGLTRVAIFDERIFSSIIPLKCVNYPPISRERIEFFVSDFYNNHKNEINFDNFYDNFYSNFVEERNSVIIDNAVDNVRDYIVSNINDEGKLYLVNKLDSLLNDIKEFSIEKAQAYHEKRVWAYDIVCHEQEYGKDAYVEFIGYNAPIKDTIGEYDLEIRKVEVVGRITRDIYERYIVEMDTLVDNNRFDFISIHQGILDKIYGVFKINDIIDEKVQAYEKCKITHAMHRYLSKKQTPNEPTDFLPQFIIHSGRSKPNSSDMPQKQPFIQFAAMDHAVRDCKYTLSELLFSAHYEQDKRQ